MDTVVSFLSFRDFLLATMMFMLLPFRTLIHRQGRPAVTCLFSSSYKSRSERWNENFEALKRFIDENGHAHITKDKFLFRWLSRQRSLCRKDSPLVTDERRKLLESLGIPLDVHDTAWEKRYAGLREFYKEHGHTMVTTAQHDTVLANWVARQRKIFRKEIPGILTEDRMMRLEKIGFLFDVHNQVWMEQYEKMVEYRAYHGDCLVPNVYESDQSLATWVDVQRTQYSKLQRGKQSYMTEERLKMLNDIDFSWNAFDAKWQKKFEEMKEHVTSNGFGISPPAHSSLGFWIKNQRMLYRAQQEDGKKNSLTRARLEKLRSLGFCL